MSDYVTPQTLHVAATPLSSAIQLPAKNSKKPLFLFGVVLLAGILFAGTQLVGDIQQTGVTFSSALPLMLLGFALLAALGFEFVNGFHDTANAVATVIYTRSLSPTVAVVWSGIFNFLGRGGFRHHLPVAN